MAADRTSTDSLCGSLVSSIFAFLARRRRMLEDVAKLTRLRSAQDLHQNPPADLRPGSLPDRVRPNHMRASETPAVCKLSPSPAASEHTKSRTRPVFSLLLISSLLQVITGRSRRARPHLHRYSSRPAHPASSRARKSRKYSIVSMARRRNSSGLLDHLGGSPLRTYNKDPQPESDSE
jgi:hypothetical protein